MKYFALLALLALGCGGPPDEAQVTLTATARGLVAVDRTAAREYTTAAAEALEAADTMAAYQEAMRPWNTLEDSLGLAASTLRSAQDDLDAWEDGTDDGARWTAAIPCLVSALEHVRDAIAAAGVEMPSELGYALTLARGFGGACSSPPPAPPPPEPASAGGVS